MADVRWTAKLPALIVGLILTIGSVLLLAWNKSRVLTTVALVIGVLGVGFITYSFTIKDWCEAYGPSDFGADFDQSNFAECLKKKGWLRL